VRNTTKIAFFAGKRPGWDPEKNAISDASSSNSLLSGSTNYFVRSTNLSRRNNRRATELLAGGSVSVAVVGSIIRRTSVTLLARNPLRRVSSSIGKRPPDLAAEVGARHLAGFPGPRRLRPRLPRSGTTAGGCAQSCGARCRWRPFASRLRQAAGPAVWALPPHEIGTLTDGLRDFMISWAPRRITDEAGHERRQSLCCGVAATQACTILREIGRS
jgi:hypothetical protein